MLGPENQSACGLEPWEPKVKDAVPQHTLTHPERPAASVSFRNVGLLTAIDSVYGERGALFLPFTASISSRH